jgi:ATP-dependent DNA ligase
MVLVAFSGSSRYPSLDRAPATRFLIDGEAVYCGEDGVSDFERLRSL